MSGLVPYRILQFDCTIWKLIVLKLTEQHYFHLILLHKAWPLIDYDKDRITQQVNTYPAVLSLL